MKNIMKRAWEIAKDGQKNFGGKVSEYFAEALKMAWNEWKAFKNNLKQANEALKEINRIDHQQEYPELDIAQLINQAKSVTFDKFNLVMKNATVVVERNNAYLRDLKSHRGLA